MMNYLVDYSNIKKALLHLDAENDASEAHGTLCGLICAEKDLLASDWFSYITPASDNSDLLAEEAKQCLSQLHLQTVSQINDPDCIFQLLLPHDQESIENRVLAVSEWCQGFLAGLTMGGVTDTNALPENSAEVTRAFLEITKANSQYYLQNTEEDESALLELIEFIRVGVLLVNEEMNPKTPSQTQAHKH